MPSVAMFVQCWYFQGKISRSTCWLVLLHFHLEVQTQKDGQIRGSILTIWSILSHVECLSRKIQFAWFWISMSPNNQSQPSLCQTKMTFTCLHCRPIQHISDGHWIAPSVVRTEHMTTFDLMAGYCQPRTNCNNLQCCSNYSKIFRQGICQTEHWDLLFCMVGFEGYLDVTAALNFYVTQTWHVPEGLLHSKYTWFNSARWWRVVSSWSRVR